MNFNRHNLNKLVKFLVLTTYRQKPPLKAHADISSRAGGLAFGPDLHLQSNFVYVSSKDSGKCVHLQRLA